MSILESLKRLEQSKIISKIILKGEFASRLKRYKKWQERINLVDEEIARARENNQDREFVSLLKKASEIQNKHILHVWHQVKSVVLPNSKKRTLMREIKWERDQFPPIFKEIEIVLDKYALELSGEQYMESEEINFGFYCCDNCNATDSAFFFLVKLREKVDWILCDKCRFFEKFKDLPVKKRYRVFTDFGGAIDSAKYA